jgi:hypothetical protein
MLENVKDSPTTYFIRVPTNTGLVKYKEMKPTVFANRSLCASLTFVYIVFILGSSPLWCARGCEIFYKW